MPFTPLHWGPALLIGLLVFPLLDLPCFLIASVIVDIEPAVLMFLGAPVWHAFFHTYLGATLAGIALVPIVYLLHRPLEWLLRLLGLEQQKSLPRITVAALLGTNLHVLLDSFLYPEMNPFFPLLGNPFLGLVTYGQILLFCFVGFVAAIPLYVFQVWRSRKRRSRKG
jgi:membrane-bound metal-dependent hydrolase YbcI (DUF457 family)